MKQLVLGILAHVDAGKTTISEALLYRAGAIRKFGRVDHGDAFLDTHALERGRGITIFSKQALFSHGESTFTLLDTPGHVDFSPEMERTLSVLDYAVLVISGTDGVQSHTETLWRLLARYRVPTFLFVNKMDLAGAERGARLVELQKRLDGGCVDFDPAQSNEAFYEALALCDETLMERYLETGAIEQDDIRTLIARRRVFPCFFGSALRLDGVDELLHALDCYTRVPTAHERFGARVFKITEDEQGTRLTHLKITGGTLAVKAALPAPEEADGIAAEKVNQIRLYTGAKFQTVDCASAGMICAVTGLSRTFAGMGLGCEASSDAPLLEPVLTYRVDLPAGTDVTDALRKLRRLAQEDPLLQAAWDEAAGEIRVQLMGAVQLEVLQSVIAERFGLNVTFSQGSIVYKETIAASVEGVGHFEPLRHYAEVHLALTPLPRGSGLHFAADCPPDTLDAGWQRLVLTHLAEKTHRGVLTGAPITDMKMTLIAGRAHTKHTEGGDFRQATYRAVRHGLHMAQSVLLEPWCRFSLTVPAACVGRAMSDLQRLHAEFAPPDGAGDMATLTGRAPVATMQDYPMEVAGYTQGRGALSCTPDGYAPCHDVDEVISKIGYDCDADVENTADSVFCAHGAGFHVRWDEVRAHMHLQTGFGVSAPPEPEPAAVLERRAARYCATLAEDAELLAIFERTYGPVRRDPLAAFASSKKLDLSEYEFCAQPTETEYLLVDGYNVIFAWDDLRALAARELDAARGQLINLLCNYQGFHRCTVILVFDAYRTPHSTGEVEQVHNISVVYTREAETADMYIEKATHELARHYRVRVVTSDGLEQLIILGHGAARVSAAMFWEELRQSEAAIRALLT